MTEYGFYELSESIQSDIITFMSNFDFDDSMVDALCQIVVDRVKEAQDA